MKDLLAYLYGGSQIESEVEETKEAIEKIMEQAEKEEPLKPKRTPLVKALSSLGIKDVDDEIEYDPEGFSLKCKEEGEYRRYVRILLEPDAMEKLAKLGWVVTRCGDVAMTNEAPEFRVRFLEITTVDSSDKDSWPAPNVSLVKKAVKAGREFMDEPGPHDDDGPLEYDDKSSDDNNKGVGDAKDGADPEGKPKGNTGRVKAESKLLVDRLLAPVNEDELQERGRHKDGCQCGFCKNMGSFGKKKKEGGEKADEPKADEPKGGEEDGGVSHGSEAPKSGEGEVQKAWNESEPPRFEDLAMRRGRPKHVKDAPVAKTPKASKSVPKAYKTPKK